MNPLTPFRLAAALCLLGLTGPARATPATTVAPATPSPEAIQGLRIPDVSLTDQEGRPVRFYSDLVKGRVVAINFIFTSCTTICPPLGANFAKLRQSLGERAGREVQLISVSVDPANDTPQRLKAWAQKFGFGPGWTLVTGEKGEVDRLRKSLGSYTADATGHSSLLLVGNDAKNSWTRVYGLAPPAQIAEMLNRMATVEGTAK
jgi:protein SCO1